MDLFYKMAKSNLHPSATRKAALVDIDCGSELIKAGGRGTHRCER